MFLDIGIGILLSIFISWYFKYKLAFLFIASGIVFSLLPDIDFLIEFLRHKSVGGKVIREHREITHYPLFYIPIVILVLFLFGKMWALFFILAVFFHFLHDSIGIGWGIKWLYPFSKKSYKFFCEKDGRLSKRFIISWEQDELKSVVEQYGDPNWIKNIYLRPSPVFIIEFLAFLFAIFVLIVYLYY